MATRSGNVSKRRLTAAAIAVLSPPAGNHPCARAGLNLEESDRRDWKGKLSLVLYLVAIVAT